MAYLILSRPQVGGTAALRNSRPLIGVDPVQAPAVSWVIRYTFYAFVFSLPFEEVYTAGGTTSDQSYSALLWRRLRYSSPDCAMRSHPEHSGGLAVFPVRIMCFWGFYLIWAPPNIPEFTPSFILSVFRLTQLLVLFWISYNLMKQERVNKATLMGPLSGGTIFLAVLQILGITSAVAVFKHIFKRSSGCCRCRSKLSCGSIVTRIGGSYLV